MVEALNDSNQTVGTPPVERGIPLSNYGQADTQANTILGQTNGFVTAKHDVPALLFAREGGVSIQGLSRARTARRAPFDSWLVGM